MKLLKPLAVIGFFIALSCNVVIAQDSTSRKNIEDIDIDNIKAYLEDKSADAMTPQKRLSLFESLGLRTIEKTESKYYIGNRVANNKTIKQYFRDSGNEDIFKKYRNAETLSISGASIVGLGVIIIVGAVISIAPEGDIRTAHALIYTGVGLTVAGIPLAVIGSSNRNRALREFNERVRSGSAQSTGGARLYFGGTRQGVGLSLRF